MSEENKEELNVSEIEETKETEETEDEEEENSGNFTPMPHCYPAYESGSSFLSVLFEIFGWLILGVDFFLLFGALQAAQEVNKFCDAGPATFFAALLPLILLSTSCCFMFAIAYVLKQLKIAAIAAEQTEAHTRETAALTRIIAQKLQKGGK